MKTIPLPESSFIVEKSEDETSDETLALAIARREDSTAEMQRATQCFEQLYERHSRLLLAFLAARTARSELEDVHQSVWQKIWQYLPEQFRGGNFRAWMHKIARNHLIDLSRKRRPEELAEYDNLEAQIQTPASQLENQERQEILSRCLQHLQKDMADIVRSRLRGEDYAEICDRMGMEPPRAHKLFFQAREQLIGCVQKGLE